MSVRRENEEGKRRGVMFLPSGGAPTMGAAEVAPITCCEPQVYEGGGLEVSALNSTFESDRGARCGDELDISFGLLYLRLHILALVGNWAS
ncbi:hypothetical protein L1887_21392 [Cichorium endivia]|nr:hypothetical protein L1887_21392 [Cichorium endivia]